MKCSILWVNLILLIDKRSAFDVLPAQSNYESKFSLWSRREVEKGRIDTMVWISMHFIITPGGRINDIFKPAHSDSYAFNITDKTRYKSPYNQTLDSDLARKDKRITNLRLEKIYRSKSRNYIDQNKLTKYRYRV